MWRYKCWRFLRWSAWAAVALGVLATAWTQFRHASFEIPFGHDRVGGTKGEGWRLILSGRMASGAIDFEGSLLTVDPGNVAVGGRGGAPIRASGAIVPVDPRRIFQQDWNEWSRWLWNWERSDETEGRTRTEYVSLTLAGVSIGGVRFTTSYAGNSPFRGRLAQQNSYERRLLFSVPILYPTFVAAVLAWLAGRKTQAALARVRRLTGFCPTCGYNLTGLSSPRCPECGRPITPPASPTPTTN